MQLLRKILLIIVGISLIIVPFCFLEYLCYLGLCPGAPSEIKNKFLTFYGYFFWIYLLVALSSMFVSHLFKITRPRLSCFFLIIPLICLLPYFYVEIKTNQIQNKYDNARRDFNKPKSYDFVCPNGKFIRHDTGGTYYYFDFNSEGDSGAMTAYYKYDELKKGLEKNSIDPTTCKNKQGMSLNQKTN